MISVPRSAPPASWHHRYHCPCTEVQAAVTPCSSCARRAIGSCSYRLLLRDGPTNKRKHPERNNPDYRDQPEEAPPAAKSCSSQDPRNGIQKDKKDNRKNYPMNKAHGAHYAAPDR